MTKREKVAWQARVRKLLVARVYGAVDETMEFPNEYDDEVLVYGRRLVLKFQRLISRIRIR